MSKTVQKTLPHLELDESQRRAVELICTERIGVVTGAPGVGKTTVLKYALDQMAGQNVLLASPTGKASKRMQEATGREARTIHRLLEYGRSDTGILCFRRDGSCPLECNVVIIDEASMIDLELAASLFAAIDATRTRLVLVGDANQLPSVGPGRVFGDIIESGRVPVVRLTTLHRAARRSWVCRNAPRVLAGDMPELERDESGGFEWLEEEGRDRAVERACEVVVKEGAQLIVPQNVGQAGTKVMNERIQDRLNPLRGQPHWGDLRQGDRVIQTRNDYDVGVFNGECGEISKIDKKIWVRFSDRDVGYDRLQAKGLKLAYAMSCHRGQGSEWNHVAVFCHSTHTYMLTRKLFYTAITRAKKRVTLIGNRQGIRAAVRNARESKRNSALVERIRNTTLVAP